jgi:hypothetical protein
MLVVSVGSKETGKGLYQSSPVHGHAMRQLPQPATSLGQCIGPAKSGAPTHQMRPSSLSRCSRALWPPGHLHSLLLNTWTHSAIGDAGPRRMAWAFTIRWQKEVAVCASLTNKRWLLSLAGDLSTTT